MLFHRHVQNVQYYHKWCNIVIHQHLAFAKEIWSVTNENLLAHGYSVWQYSAYNELFNCQQYEGQCQGFCAPRMHFPCRTCVWASLESSLSWPHSYITVLQCLVSWITLGCVGWFVLIHNKNLCVHWSFLI